ncbi:Hypothetical protein FKW44_022491, partial [Caligus rogercresseyi]
YRTYSEAKVYESLRRDGIFREKAIYLAAADSKIARRSVGFTNSHFVKELVIRALAFNKAKSTALELSERRPFLFEAQTAQLPL